MSDLVVPGLHSYITALRHQSSDASLDRLIDLIKSRQIDRPGPCATATTHLLLRVVAESKPKSVDDLLDRVRQVGQKLQAAHRQELTLGNIVRRTLGLIREISEGPTKLDGQAQHARQETLFSSSGGSAFNVPSGESNSKAWNGGVATSAPIKTVKDDTLEGLREILDELEQADEQISNYAAETIQRNDTILTFTGSLTVQKFLLAAAKAIGVTKTKKARFSILVVEGFPNEHDSTQDIWVHGHRKHADREEADLGTGDKQDPLQSRFKALVAAGIEVTIIPDAAVHAFMPRINKVILPAYALLPDGGFIGASGTAMLARAARQSRAPVIVVGGIYKLSPVWPLNVESLIELGNPSSVLKYSEGELTENIEVLNSLTDYVPPALVSLYLTNIGGFAPSYMYRIAADHYRMEDLDW